MSKGKLMNRGLTRRDFLKVSGAGLAGATLLGTAGCGGARSGGGGGDGEQFTLRLAHELTNESVKGLTATRFKEIVEENTNGRVQVNIFPNGEILPADELPQGVQNGTADMTIVASADIATLAPELQVLDLPFIVNDLEQVSEVIAEDTAVGQLLFDNQNLRDNNLRVAAPFSSGIKQISTNVETRTLADMQGQRIRVQESETLLQTYRAWEAAPVQIGDFGEVYTQLDQGVIDGQENPYSTIWSESVYEVQDYVIELNHGFIGYLGIMNQGFLDSLPDELRQTVLDAATEASDYNFQLATEENMEAKQQIIDEGGTEIIEITGQERQAFKDAVVPTVYEQSAEVVGQDVIDELLERVTSR